MRALAAILVTLGLVACSPEPDPIAPMGCLSEAPQRLGDSCAGDGECGNWLVCRTGSCELPAAVSGEGGEVLLIDDDEILVEVARGDLARSRGLGDRPCIVDGWGLLIEFPSAGDHLITTTSMRFDLDIAMAGPDGIVHTVHLNAPAGGKALYGASEPVRWVLETPAGAREPAVGAHLVRR